MKKILVFAKEVKGGSGTFLKDLEHFNLPQFVFTFCLFKKDSFNPLKNYFLIAEKYPTDFGFTFEKICVFFFNVLNSYKIICKEKPSIIFVPDLYSIIVLSFIKFTFKRELVFVVQINNDLLSVINEHPNLLFRIIIRFLLKNSLSLATKIIFVSNEMLDFNLKYLNLNKKKCITIHYGVKERLDLIRKNSLEEAIKIISVGRLDRQKDFKTIVLAFELLSKKYSNIRLQLVGDGEEKNNLVKLSKKLNLENKIRFFGWVNNVYPIMKKADIFVFSSHYEGFPYSIVEAIHCHLPIVATRCKFGVSELLDNGKCGILVDVGNPIQMAQSIEKIILNEKIRRLYSNRLVRQSKKFTLTKMKKNYEDLFLSLV